MARDITLTFDDGSSHVYKNAPDSITPDQVIAQARTDFSGKSITHLDGGVSAARIDIHALEPFAKESTAGAGRGSMRPPSPPGPGLVDRIVSGVKSLADPETYRLARTPEQEQQAAEEMRKLRGQSALESLPTSAPTAPVAPVDAKMHEAMKVELGAMPRAQRLKANELPGWKGQTARAANAELDAGQAGVDRLHMGDISPTVEGRAGYYAGQGASHEAANAMAAADMQTGQRSRMATAKAEVEPSALQAALDSTNRKPGDHSAAGFALETAGDAARGVVRAGEGLAGSAWSGIRAASDLMLGPDSGLSKVAANAAGAAKDAQDRIQSPDAGSVTQQVFESAFTNVPVMLTFGFGSKALAAMGAQSAAQSYGEARDAGHSVDDSLERGVWHGVAEALGEKFSLPVLGSLFSKAVSNVSTKEMGHVLADLLVKEQLGEQVTTALQDAYDKFGQGGTRRDMTLDDYLGDAVNTAKVTLGQTLLMGGAAQVAHAVTGAGAAAPAPRMPTAMEMAQARGFLVNPPLTTDSPSTQRSKMGAMFQDLGAKYGLPKQAVDATIAAADGKPLSALGPFFRRAADALQKRGLFAEQVHPDVMGVFDGPHAEQGDEPTKESGQADVDVSGLSEPSEASIQQAPATPATAGTAVNGAVPELPQGSLADAAIQAGAFDDVPTVMGAKIDDAAHRAATSPLNDKPEPTQAQKEAGNYAKGHLTLHGLDIAIENPQGSKRSGVSPDGVAWESTMQHHYGYIKGTVGNDKDHVDTFIGGNPESTRAFVVDQIDPRTGKFDEHKVVLGADSQEQARQIYLSNYEKGWRGLGAMTELPMAAFKSWVKDGAKKAPLGSISLPQAAPANEGPAGVTPKAMLTPSDFDAPAQPASIGGKRVADMQTGQLIRFANMAKASDAVRKAAAEEVKRREIEFVYGQQEKARARQEAEIVEQARDQQVTQALATSKAAEVDAPTPMALAFKAALEKKAAKQAKAEQPPAEQPATQKPERPDELIELRKRESVLKSLLSCVGG